MLRFPWQVCAILVLCLPSLAEQEVPSFRKWESHFKVGTQSYVNEISPDPGTAGMYGLLAAYRLSPRSMIGASYAAASYRIGVREEFVGTLLLFYRYSWRVDKKFRPYLDAGAGIADPILGYDSGAKGAVTFALGGAWWFNPHWGIAVESRGVSWSQDDTFLFEGSSITVGSNEFTLSLCRGL